MSLRERFRLRWVLRLAFRDARQSRTALSLLGASIIVGAAALVSLGSIRATVSRAIASEAKPLLGADLLIYGRAPFNAEAEALFSELGGETAREVSFASMVTFDNGGSRLVQVNAGDPSYPFYGALETDPPDMKVGYAEEAPQALVDRGIMLQYGSEVGERFKIGAQEYQIAAALLRVPGMIEARSVVAPQIYIPRDSIDPALLQKGSRINYRIYFRFADSTNVAATVKRIEKKLERLDLRSHTVKDRQANMERGLQAVYRFLDLLGFVAVILGCIGVASASRIYVRSKVPSIAVLRCLGARPEEAMGVFFCEIAAFGACAVLLGGAFGVALQAAVPTLLRSFLPLSIGFELAWRPLLGGMAASLSLLLLFTLPALFSIREVSPLVLFRTEVEQRTGSRRTAAALWGLCILSTAVLAIVHSGERFAGAVFAAASLCAALLLLLLSRVGVSLLRKAASRFGPFYLRQGLSNLFRPYNQTTTLFLCIGMCCYLAGVMLNLQASTIKKAEHSTGSDRPNLVLFDVQQDQLDEVTELLAESKLPLLESAPVVSMRLRSVKSVPLAELKKEPIPRWALYREYRSTYRSSLSPAEELLSGRWVERVASFDPATDVVPVSLEKRQADRLKVGLGDELEFDVQGITVKTRIESVREVDWQQVRPNFFVVFPEGVLEAAPQFHVVVTRFDSAEQGAAFQRQTVSRFPNVSIIDLTLVLETLDAVLGQIMTAVKVVGAFSLCAALLVLWCAVRGTTAQRSRESALLKTLGASRRTVVLVGLSEYMYLGLVGALSGLLLAAVSGNILSYYVFEIVGSVPVLPNLLVGITAICLTALVGLLASRESYRRPAVEVLRQS